MLPTAMGKAAAMNVGCWYMLGVDKVGTEVRGRRGCVRWEEMVPRGADRVRVEAEVGAAVEEGEVWAGTEREGVRGTEATVAAAEGMVEGMGAEGLEAEAITAEMGEEDTVAQVREAGEREERGEVGMAAGGKAEMETEGMAEVDKEREAMERGGTVEADTVARGKGAMEKAGMAGADTVAASAASVEDLDCGQKT